MQRRGFLVQAARAGSVLLILPAGWSVSGCSNSANGEFVTTPPAPAGSSLRFTSEVVASHTHDFSIAMADLMSPPADGLSGVTTTTLGHYHTVVLSPDDLTQIQAGGTVNRVTTVMDGHAHNFKLNLATGEGPATTPPSTASGGSGG
jgi:hypothetical protein